MNAREYLLQLQALKEDIHRLEERIREIDAEMCSPGAVRYDAIRVQSAPENKLENNIDRKEVLKERLTKKQREYDRLYMEISDRLDSLEIKHRRALKFYYLDHRSITWIAGRMHYSREYVYQILSDARHELEMRYL